MAIPSALAYTTFLPISIVMLDRLITAVEDGCIYNDTFVMEGGYVQSVEDETVYLECKNGETFEAYVVD